MVTSRLASLSCLLTLACCLQAQSPANHLTFDATAPAAPPIPVPTHLGANRSPAGETLAVNNQYLTRSSKPWIPVMGEFHYSRYPQSAWEEEILKMKASGVQIIATYVIWIHVEEIQGQFDWSGQRDLRAFASLCARHGMLLYPRIGPWAHGELRNGGFPDWVLKNSAVRSNDPVYLSEVRQYFEQIGGQLKGLLWKDGGPVIGIQIENEYALRGPGQGTEHLATLRKMAIDSGLDVPLYTVTGWDNATVPLDLFLPVYGGYADAPWYASATVLPPSEVYAFRFGSRVSGDMGAHTGAPTDDAQRDAALRASVPFFTAELGGGTQDTYHRRPVLAPADTAAMIPVILGSGANLLGYYMFHGGVNPDGKLTTLQESQRTDYPNDLPVKSYDFQAPLGQFGQMNQGLPQLKLDHYFLNDFGQDLAPARVIAPDLYPSGPADMSVLRASLRIHGESGFLFVNNYIRENNMPERPATQFEIKLPEKSLLVPAQPLNVPANSYFIWPVNLDVNGIPLRYATAQPILRARSAGDSYIFFAATPGIPVEFAFPAEFRSSLDAHHAALAQQEGLVRAQNVPPGRGVALTVHGKVGVTHLVVLSPEDAKNLWRVTINEKDVLLLTPAQVFSDGKQLIARQVANPDFDIAVFRPTSESHDRDHAAEFDSPSALFQHLVRHVPERSIAVKFSKTRDFGKAPAPLTGPKPSWRSAAIAMMPEESSFDRAAQWTITIPPAALNGLSDLYLAVRYQGDQARLSTGDRLLIDDFFNGLEWRIGMKRYLQTTAADNFTLSILPLDQKARIFFEPSMTPSFDVNGQAGSLQSVKLLPEYEIHLQP